MTDKPASVALSLGTVVKPWGKIGAILFTLGERYYMLQRDDVSRDGRTRTPVTSLIPAIDVERAYHAETLSPAD